ncbi:MAG: GNAT family N-acetyltransferase [Candidatus Kerfeldbacteria bacterium]|nr:GNAT family N-acetyltransferase [Candidatus Kerfeldbacteria bacterium]
MEIRSGLVSVHPFDEDRHGCTALAQLFCNAFNRPDADTVASMVALEMRSGHRYIIASVGPRCAGFVSWRPWGEPRHRFAELYHIGVHPDFQGTEVSDRLMRALEENLHPHFQQFGYPGCRMVFVLTHAANTRAQAFYARHGYRIVATLPEFFRENTDEIVMMKFFAHNRIARE